MKKWLICLMMALLMAGCVALVGCGKEKALETSSAPAAQQKGSSELEDIMKTARQATDMSFEIVSTSSSNGQSVNNQGKYWISGDKIRMEIETEGMKAITIVDSQGNAWMYNPADKTAMKLPSMEDETEMPNQWSEENDLEGYKILGHEKIDGYDCAIVSVTEADDTSKMWLRKDIGMPVKIEAQSAEGSMVVQYKNFKIGKQAANLFELPADAKIIDMSAMPTMPDVPNMPKQ